jgi:hypothetical protein
MGIDFKNPFVQILTEPIRKRGRAKNDTYNTPFRRSGWVGSYFGWLREQVSYL